MRLLIVLAVAVATVSAASLESILKPGFPEGRIINGLPAAKGQAPFIVSLKRGDHFCGGSLIDPHWVLTAAHCLTFDSFQVVAGLHKRDDESDVQIRTVPNKSVQFSHEKYDGGVGPYDIGLIYFAIPFDLIAMAGNGFAAVATINLPSGQYKETGPGKLFGWGIDNSGSKPNTLQTLDVDIIDYNECNVVMASIFPVDPVNICSYTAGTTDGACSSDSGGPLVRYTADGPEIVGVVSWGLTPCDAHSYPSVYTKVSAFKDWIQTTIDGIGNSTSFW